MKKIICSILIISFLLYSVSCTSFYPLNNDEKIENYIHSNDRLLFILKDNRTLDVNAEDCLFISEPQDYIYGIGDLTNKSKGEIKNFEGEIKRGNVDSTKSVILNAETYYIYWFNDSLRVAFLEGEFIDLCPESGSGFWLIMEKSNKQLFEKIYLDDIKEIQVAKINYLTTSLVLIPFIALLVLVAVDAFPYAGGFGFTPPDPDDVHF